jgi:hypothetical protein
MAQVVGVFEHAGAEAMVDLQHRHRESPQAGQRRAAGAEIVDREMHPRLEYPSAASPPITPAER